MKITKDMIETYKQTQKAFYAIKENFDNRVVEVMNLIAKVFNAKLVGVWFYGAEEGDMGTCSYDELADKDDDCQISVEIMYSEKTRHSMDVWDWDYAQGFPKRFLWMDNDDIINEIKSAIKETKERETKEKLKKKEQRESKKKRIELAKEEAKKKLSKEELKLLKIR